MSKKRRTRREKILAQLRKRLAQNTPQSLASQEAISSFEKSPTNDAPVKKKTENSFFSSGSKLIKEDLSKALALTLIIFSFEFMLYWWLK